MNVKEIIRSSKSLAEIIGQIVTQDTRVETRQPCQTRVTGATPARPAGIQFSFRTTETTVTTRYRARHYGTTFAKYVPSAADTFRSPDASVQANLAACDLVLTSYGAPHNVPLLTPTF